MKACAYCGKENQDAAATCAECGTDSFMTAKDASGASQGTAKSSEDRLRAVLTDPVGLFRALVLISTVTYVIWFFQFQLCGHLISQGTWDALSWHGFGALLPIPKAIGWLLMLLSVAVAVGLWMFSVSARTVFAAFSAFWIVTSLLSGVQVQTALDSFLLLLTDMATGAILVMAYTAPLKQRFE